MRAFALLVLLASAAAVQADNFVTRVHETVTIDIPGATAAYAIDPSIADVATPAVGRVSITGRSAGTTQLVAVTPSGTTSFLITIAAAHPVSVPAAVKAGEPIARAESRYSSSTAQVTNVIDVFTNGSERRTRVHLWNVHYTGERLGRSSDAFPSMFYRVTTPSHEYTLCDELVDLSPLTVRSTQLRGMHYRDRALELHAGYAASTMYEDLFLPADRRWGASASYGITSGPVRLVPGIHAFFSEPQGTSARRGVIASLAAEHRRGDVLFARAEIAGSRSLAASGELTYQTNDQELRARAWYKPEDFPTLGLGELPGTHGEIDWTRRVTPRLTVDSLGTFDRLELRAAEKTMEQTLGSTRLSVRYAPTKHLTLFGGADASLFESEASSFRTIAVPAGIAFDAASFGASIAYRLIDTTGAARHGDALRITARAGGPLIRASIWGERQRQAPTLDIIFGQQPGLELALLKLGISVHSAEELARVVRDNAALINLGFIEGVTIDLTPQRDQAGAEIAFSRAGGRDQLRLHALYDRLEGIGATRSTALATLSYSRRLFGATDVYGSWSWWRTMLPSATYENTAFEIGVRQRFDGLPGILRRGGTIEGTVFLDPELRGVRTQGSGMIADVEIILDGNRTVRTDRNGVYSFRNVGAGQHWIAANLPPSRPAFFTTRSRVEAEAPTRVDFGLVWSPARILGRVRSDADRGVAGAVIRARSTVGVELSATTDSNGEFAIAVPPGQYTLRLALESLPSGYSLAGDVERAVDAIAAEPRHAAFDVRALRSIAGTAAGAAEVRIEPLGRTAVTDGAGNFVFRSLPAGTFTLLAGSATSSVTLPPEPVSLRGVVLSGHSAKTSVAGRFFVQLGAFRDVANARILIRRALHAGTEPQTATQGDLTLVRVGPFASRAAAVSASHSLRAAGFETAITSP
jgi:hypothetical protein